MCSLKFNERWSWILIYLEYLQKESSVSDLNTLLLHKKFHYYATALFMHRENLSFEQKNFEHHFLSQISDPLCRCYL